MCVNDWHIVSISNRSTNTFNNGATLKDIGRDKSYEFTLETSFPITAFEDGWSTMNTFDDGKYLYAKQHGATWKYYLGDTSFGEWGLTPSTAEATAFTSNDLMLMISNLANVPTTKHTFDIVMILDGSNVNRGGGSSAPDYCNAYKMTWHVTLFPYKEKNTLHFLNASPTYYTNRGTYLSFDFASLASGNNTTSLANVSLSEYAPPTSYSGCPDAASWEIGSDKSIKYNTAGKYNAVMTQTMSSDRKYGPAPDLGSYPPFLSLVAEVKYNNRITVFGEQNGTYGTPYDMGVKSTATKGIAWTIPTSSVEFGSTKSVKIDGTTVSTSSYTFTTTGSHKVTIESSDGTYYGKTTVTYDVNVVEDTKEACNFAISPSSFYVTYNQLINGGGINLNDYITVHSGATLSFTDASHGGGGTIGMFISAAGVVTMGGRPTGKYTGPYGPTDPLATVEINCPETATHHALSPHGTAYVYTKKDNSDLAAADATKTLTVSELESFDPASYFTGTLATWVKNNHGTDGKITAVIKQGATVVDKASITSPGTYTVELSQGEVYTVNAGTASYTLEVTSDAPAYTIAYANATVSNAVVGTPVSNTLSSTPSGIDASGYSYTLPSGVTRDGSTYTATAPGTYNISADHDDASNTATFTMTAKYANRLSAINPSVKVTSGTLNIHSNLNNFADGTCHYSCTAGVVSANVLSITTPGTHTVTVTQDEGTNYWGTSTPVTFQVVVPAANDLTAGADVTKKVLTELPSFNPATNVTGGNGEALTVTYQKGSETPTATKPTAVGEYKVIISQPETATVLGKTVQYTMTVVKEANPLAATDKNITVGEATSGYLVSTALSNSGNGNTINFTILSGTGGAIDGSNNLTGVAGQTYRIRATQATNDYYEAADIQFNVTVGGKTACNFELTKTSDDVKLSAIKSGVDIASYIKSGSHTATYTYEVTGGTLAGAAFTGSTVKAAGATGEGTVIVTVTCPETAEYAGPTTQTLTLNVKYDEYDDPADEPKVAPGHTSGETITKKYWEVSGSNSLDLSGYVTGTGITFTAPTGASINANGSGFKATAVGTYAVTASKNDGTHAPFSATFNVKVEQNDNDLAVTNPSINKSVADAASGLNIATLAGVTYNTTGRANDSTPKYSITGGTATINATTGEATGLAAGGSYTITITQDETATALGGTKTVTLTVGDKAANDLAVVEPTITKKVSELVVSELEGNHTVGNGNSITTTYSKGGTPCGVPTTFGKYTVTYTQDPTATVNGATVSYELIVLKDVDPDDSTLPHEVPGADKDVEPGEDIIPTIVTPGDNTKEPTVIATKQPGTPTPWPYVGGKVVVPDDADPGEYSVEITYPEDPDNFIPEVTVGPFTIFVDEQPTVTPTGVTPTLKEGDTTLPDFSTAFTSNNTETPTYYVKKDGSWVEITPGLASTLTPGDYEVQVVKPEDHTNHIAGKPLDPSGSGDFTLAVVSDSGKPSGEPKEDLTPGDDILDGVDPGDNQKEPVVKIQMIEPTPGTEIVIPITGTYPDQEAKIPGGTEKGKYEVTIIYPDDPDNHVSGEEIGPKVVYIEEPNTFTIDPSKTPVISEVGTEPDFDAPYTSNNDKTPTYYIKTGGSWVEITPGLVPTLPKGDYEVQVVIPADHTNYIEGKPLDPGATSGDFTLKIADPNPADKVKDEVNLVRQQLPYDPTDNVSDMPTDPSVLAGVTTEIKPKGDPDTSYSVLPGDEIPSSTTDGDYTIRITIPADPSGPYPEKVIEYDVHVGPEFHYDGDTDKETLDAIMDEDLDVVMDRTFIAGWNTICLPFPLGDTQIYTAFGPGAQVWEFSRATTDMIMHFTKQDDLVEMSAGVPYMIYLPAAVVKPTFNGVTIETSVGGTVTKTDDNGYEYKFTGAVTATALGTGNGLRMLSGTSIKKPSSAGTLKASRCYYQFPASAGAKSGMMMFMNFNETTGIEADATVSESENQVIYTIGGQRVKSMSAPGVYIVNGKKVVKK